MLYAHVFVKCTVSCEFYQCYHKIATRRISKQEPTANNMNSPIVVQILRRINPGYTDDAKEEVDIKSLNQDDVKSLRTTDPFMYYSIPGIHRANMHLLGIEDFDHSNTQALCSSEVQTPRRRPSPPANKKPKRSTTVTRRTSISCEAHPDVIMEEFLDELEDLSEDELEALNSYIAE